MNDREKNNKDKINTEFHWAKTKSTGDGTQPRVAKNKFIGKPRGKSFCFRDDSRSVSFGYYEGDKLMSDYLLKAPEGSRKNRKRVGRGSASGVGTTSGRGNKGQHARSGGRTYVGFEGGQMPLYRRVAHRGFSNYRFHKECLIVNLRDIEQKFCDGDTVDVAALIKKGLIKNANFPVKILGDGAITKRFTVLGARISVSAKEKIVQVGGRTEEVSEQTVKNSKAVLKE